MIGRRPEPMPGSEPGRWRVMKSRWLGHRVAPWCVEREGCGGAAFFRTWEEAQEYADRMARTREYVLPRISHSNDWVPDMPTLKIGWEHHPVETSFWVEDRGLNFIYIRPDELLPLALALAALAEMEGAE